MLGKTHPSENLQNYLFFRFIRPVGLEKATVKVKQIEEAIFDVKHPILFDISEQAVPLFVGHLDDRLCQPGVEHFTAAIQ